MKPISGERASTDVHGGAGGADKHNHRRSSPSAAAFFSKAAGQLDAATARIIRWCPTRRRALPAAVCVAAALAAAVVVLAVAGGGAPNGMPASFFFDDEQGLDDALPWDLTVDHLLDGLLTSEFDYKSCRSRYDFARYYNRSSHKPSPFLIAKLRKQEALQRRCGPGTAAHKEALRRLESGEAPADNADDDSNDQECRYVVYISYRGLGNRMLAIASAFLYAALTDRVLLVDGGKEDVADLFCEPFPRATWLLPRAGAGWWPWPSSPLGRLQSFDENSKESLGNMLQSGAAVVSTNGGNVSWSPERAPPAYVYLHLAGGYGYHDKLFFCGAHQRLLRDVPWLLMRTDNYVVPGLFLVGTFRAELEAMFPDKDAVFYLVGRYLFHPSNAVWHAVTRYHRAHLAGAGRRVGIQVRVFHKKQPPQRVLDQVLSCVRNEHLLPPSTSNATSPSSSKNVVLVTSLSPWYAERIRDEYGSWWWEVHQPSHEGRQRRGDAAHDMRALSEMLLLGTCDTLVTSGFSTFGYVAQGLAGLRPWVMPRPPMWAQDWREGVDPDGPPCRRMASVEPCFHSPSAYDCEAGRDVDLREVRPYIKRCVDVSWGIKLVNESSSQR